MTGPEFLRAQAALVAWRDGHEAGVNGMLGILFVIRNRSEQPKWSDLQRAVQDTANESAETLAGSLWPDVRNPDFQQILQAADSVFAEVDPMRDKLTSGALYYSPANDPFTFRERVAQVNTLLFYR